MLVWPPGDGQNFRMLNSTSEPDMLSLLHFSFSAISKYYWFWIVPELYKKKKLFWTCEVETSQVMVNKIEVLSYF